VQPFLLKESVFAPRCVESEARAFYDTARIRRRVFNQDWARVLAKDRVKRMLVREAGGEEEVIGALQKLCAENYGRAVFVFNYYATVGDQDPFAIQVRCMVEASLSTRSHACCRAFRAEQLLLGHD